MLWVDDGLWLGYLYGNFNLKSVFLASSYMVGLSWLCQTLCFSIRRYEHQSWNDNIITCNTEGNDEICVSTDFFCCEHIWKVLSLPQQKQGNLFRSREPIGDISLVYLDLMKRKERPKSNLKNGRWDWEIHRLFICTTICTANNFWKETETWFVIEK